MMFEDQYGYAVWKYTKDGIQERLDRTLKGIDKVKAAGIKFDSILVHGTSGTWLGALLVLRGYKVIMARKPGEASHGSPVEGCSPGCQLEKAIFVDDLICTGRTINTVKAIVEETQRKQIEKYDMFGSLPLEIVAIVLHDGIEENGEGTHLGIPVFCVKGQQ